MRSRPTSCRRRCTAPRWVQLTGGATVNLERALAFRRPGRWPHGLRACRRNRHRHRAPRGRERPLGDHRDARRISSISSPRRAASPWTASASPSSTSSKAAFTVSLIPVTLAATVAGAWRVGTAVNLEVDLIARYVARTLEAREAAGVFTTLAARGMSPMSLASVEDAIADIRAGKFVIIVDDEDRENEGDLAIAADRITPEAVNFMATHGRGLICVPLRGLAPRRARRRRHGRRQHVAVRYGVHGHRRGDRPRCDHRHQRFRSRHHHPSALRRARQAE